MIDHTIWCTTCPLFTCMLFHILRLKSMRAEAKKLEKDYDKTEDDLKALQSCGMIIGEVIHVRCIHPASHHKSIHPLTGHSFLHLLSLSPTLSLPPMSQVLRQLDEDRFIVKASSGPRYVVGCRKKVRCISVFMLRAIWSFMHS